MWRGVVSFSGLPGGPLQGPRLDARDEDHREERPSFSRLPATAARSGEHARPALRQPAVTEVFVRGEASVLGGIKRVFFFFCRFLRVNMFLLAGCGDDLALFYC